MKKEISTVAAVIAIALLAVGGWFAFQKATGPIRSENPSPDVTKMSAAEIEQIRHNASPDGLH